MSISEEDRIQALRNLEIMGSLPDPHFDRLTRLACRIAATDYAHICFIDSSIRWIKAATDWTCQPLTSRDRTICSDVVAGATSIAIDDLINHPSPIYRRVHSSLGFRSFVGVPITTQTGHAIGVLAAMSRSGVRLDDTRLTALRDLAFLANRETLIRKAAMAKGRGANGTSHAAPALAGSNGAIDKHVAVLRSVNDGIIVVRSNGLIAFVNPAAEKLLGLVATSLLGQPFATMEPETSGRSAIASDALRQSLQDGVERHVRSAVLGETGLPPVTVDCLVTPIKAVNPIGAVVIFRRAGTGAASNGVELRATLREVTRLKEQIARLEPSQVMLAPVEANAIEGGNAFAIGDLLDLIRAHEHDQIARARQLCDGAIEGPRGVTALLGLRPPKMLSGPSRAETDPSHGNPRSRIERWREPVRPGETAALALADC